MKQSFGRIPFRKGYPKCPSRRSKSQPVGVIRTTSTTRRTIVAAAFRASVSIGRLVSSYTYPQFIDHFQKKMIECVPGSYRCQHGIEVVEVLSAPLESLCGRRRTARPASAWPLIGSVTVAVEPTTSSPPGPYRNSFFSEPRR
jgi:hypothetical protein